MSLARGSILFNRARLALVRNKSSFTYDSDKTFAQRWVIKQTKRQQGLQKFWAPEDIPLWWKSTSDRLIVTFVVGASVAVTIDAAYKLYLFGQGKL